MASRAELAAQAATGLAARSLRGDATHGCGTMELGETERNNDRGITMPAHTRRVTLPEDQFVIAHPAGATWTLSTATMLACGALTRRERELAPSLCPAVESHAGATSRAP
jgi:hypothetical protein